MFHRLQLGSPIRVRRKASFVDTPKHILYSHGASKRIPSRRFPLIIKCIEVRGFTSSPGRVRTVASDNCFRLKCAEIFGWETVGQ
jgi:hypothetical protein